MEIKDKIYANPFVKIVIPIILGVVLSEVVDIGIVVLWTLFAVLYVGAWVTIGRRFGSLYVAGALLLCASALAQSYQTIRTMPTQRLYLCAEISDTPFTDGRWQKTTATITHYRLSDSEWGDGSGEESGKWSGEKYLGGSEKESEKGLMKETKSKSSQWVRTNEKVFLNIDTCYRVALGEQIACRGYVNSFDTQGMYKEYGKLMRRRGFVGTLYVTPGNLKAKSPTIGQTPLYYAKRLQSVAVERLSRLEISPESRSIASTMIAGERRGADRSLRESYSRVGASHLLAVSGLHVGIVFALVNILLYMLPALKRGHIAKNIIVIVSIWLYAALSGLSPSVVRAAMMFSGAQIALAANLSRDAANVMLGTAAVMLLLTPNNLFDISFQLSFIAVFFIILTYSPLFNAVKCRSKLLNALISLLLVSAIATIGTLPMVSYKFGVIPLMGVVLSPLLILCANFALMIGISWIIAPIEAMQTIVSHLMEQIIGLQNLLVGSSSGLSFAAIDYRMPAWLTVVCYIILGGTAIWIWTREKREVFKIEYDDRD